MAKADGIDIGAVRERLLQMPGVGAVHDLSDGGLLVAAADVALASQVGLTLDAPASEPHGALFGEDQARYLIASPNAADVLKAVQ